MANKAKSKGSKDIAYRLIMAIMAACVPIAAYFADYFYYEVQSDIFKLIAQLQGNSSDTGITWDAVSLHKIVRDYLPSFTGGTGDSNLAEIFAPMKTPAVWFAVFFVLAIVLAIVIFFFACFSKKKTVPLCLSAGGLLAMIGVYTSFHYVALPVLDGTVNLGSFTANGGIFAQILSSMATVSDFRLTTGFFLMLILFITMTLWAGANKIVEIGEKPGKA